jgi:hypothetical protein
MGDAEVDPRILHADRDRDAGRQGLAHFTFLLGGNDENLHSRVTNPPGSRP